MKEIEILVPKLGMDTTEATITAWMVHEGDTVQIGTVLLELETEKVNFALESEVHGRVGRIVRPVGAVVPVGDVVGILQTD